MGNKIQFILGSAAKQGHKVKLLCFLLYINHFDLLQFPSHSLFYSRKGNKYHSLLGQVLCMHRSGRNPKSSLYSQTCHLAKTALTDMHCSLDMSFINLFLPSDLRHQGSQE